MGSSTLKESIQHLKTALSEELNGLKLLKGENLQFFKEIFNLSGDVEIYFNKYCVVFVDGHTHDQMSFYLPQDSLVLRAEVPEYNANIWVYHYFNSQIFNDYLK